MKNKVTVIGNWHLSYCFTGYLSQFNEVDYQVTDHKNYHRLLKEGVLIDEPGIKELFLKNRKNISINLFQNKVDINAIVIIAEDTEINHENEPNVAKILEICQKINSIVKEKTEIIISSQVPVSTTQLIKSKILRNNPLISVTVFPENLQLGNSLKKLTDPQFIFFGVDDRDKCESSVPEVFNYTGQTKIIKTDYNSAELIKHGINSFIASNIIYGNEFGKVVRDFGGNLELIIETIKLDNRVSSSAPIKPGAPISGGTLLRDLQVLTKNSQELGNYWQRLIQFNQYYKTLVYQILRRRFLDDLSEINCLVLGSNYKINSNSARNSYAQDLIKLLDKKVKSIYVTKSSDSHMENRGKELLFISSLDEVITKIDCVILLYNPYSREDYLSFIDKNPGVFIIDFINNKNFYVSVKVDLHLLGA